MRSLVAIIISAVLVACANPSIVRVNQSEVANLDIKSVYVPRFEGNPAFVEESTDMFIAKLEPQVSAKIVQGSALRRESTDVLAGGNLASPEQAIAAAKKAGAQIVVMGKVTSHSTLGMLNGFSTIRVINVANGDVVANFHRPSGLLIAYSEHQCVMEAVSLTANDVAKVINKEPVE